jgi:hypothetical protein
MFCNVFLFVVLKLFLSALYTSFYTGYIAIADPSDRLLAGIVGSNPAAGMDVSLLWVLCVVR